MSCKSLPAHSAGAGAIPLRASSSPPPFPLPPFRGRSPGTRWDVTADCCCGGEGSARHSKHIRGQEKGPFTKIGPCPRSHERALLIFRSAQVHLPLEMAAGCRDRISFIIPHNNVAYPQSVETELVLKNVPSCSFRALTCPVPPSRCLTPTPTRIMTGATKRWILSPRLQSTSWRSGWRSWSSSLWSWRKVGKTQASHQSAVPLIYVLSVRDST